MSLARLFCARCYRLFALVPSLLFASGLLLVACSEGTQPIDDRFAVDQPVLLSVVVDDGDVTVEAGVAGAAIVLDHDGGAVVIETNNGLIEYAGAIESGRPNELLTANGSIVVALAGHASLMLDAKTSNGAVTSRYAMLEAERSPTELWGRVAGGEATLRLRATNGWTEVR